MYNCSLVLFSCKVTYIVLTPFCSPPSSFRCSAVRLIASVSLSQPYVDHFTHEKQLFPLSDALKPKSSFAPSKWEAMKVSKLVSAIKAGRMKSQQPPHKPKFYNLWGESDKVRRAQYSISVSQIEGVHSERVLTFSLILT